MEILIRITEDHLICGHMCACGKCCVVTFPFRADYDCFQIELSKNYGIQEWRDDVKNVLLKAGLDNKQMVFLFSDTQVSNTVHSHFSNCCIYHDLLCVD